MKISKNPNEPLYFSRDGKSTFSDLMKESFGDDSIRSDIGLKVKGAVNSYTINRKWNMYRNEFIAKYLDHTKSGMTVSKQTIDGTKTTTQPRVMWGSLIDMYTLAHAMDFDICLGSVKRDEKTKETRLTATQLCRTNPDKLNDRICILNWAGNHFAACNTQLTSKEIVAFTSPSKGEQPKQYDVEDTPVASSGGGGGVVQGTPSPQLSTSDSPTSTNKESKSGSNVVQKIPIALEHVNVFNPNNTYYESSERVKEDKAKTATVKQGKETEDGQSSGDDMYWINTPPYSTIIDTPYVQNTLTHQGPVVETVKYTIPTSKWAKMTEHKVKGEVKPIAKYFDLN